MSEPPDYPDQQGIPKSDGTVPPTPRRRPFFQPDPPPLFVVRLGFAAGALEGLIAGWIYGGIGAIFLSTLFGAPIGSVIAIIAWRIRRRTHGFIRPFLIGILIEALGGCLIVLTARFNAPMPLECCIWMGIWLSATVPFGFLYLKLLRREILAAYRGTIAGVIVCSIGLAITMGMIGAQENGGIAAAVGYGFIGVLMGIVAGCFLGSLLGAFVGALVNVTRTTIAPTYGGLAVAIGIGIAGQYVGEVIAGGFGGIVGLALGVPYGALIGIRLGKLATPRLSAMFRQEGENATPNLPLVLDLSNARELSDAEPARRVLAEMLLLALQSRIQCFHLEQKQDDTTCTAAFLTESPPSSHAWPLPLPPSLIQELKKTACIESNCCPKIIDRQERLLHLRLKHHVLDVSLVYQSDFDGERIDLRWIDDPVIAKRAERVAKNLRFIVKKRAEFDTSVYLGREAD